MKEKKAKEFTKGDSQILVNFLNKESDLPIIAHFVKYDKDDCLRPAFMRVGNIKNFPPDKRWVCTWNMAHKRTDLIPKKKSKSLDSLLKHFKYKPRDPEDPHDAHLDCQLAAKVYMKLK